MFSGANQVSVWELGNYIVTYYIFGLYSISHTLSDGKLRTWLSRSIYISPLHRSLRALSPSANVPAVNGPFSNENHNYLKLSPTSYVSLLLTATTIIFVLGIMLWDYRLLLLRVVFNFRFLFIFLSLSLFYCDLCWKIKIDIGLISFRLSVSYSIFNKWSLFFW